MLTHRSSQDESDMKISEYLDSIADSDRRNGIETAINAALECIEWERRYLPSDLQEISFSVLNDDSIQAEGSESFRLIQFSTGLIEHFERVKFPDIKIFVPDAPWVLGTNLVLSVGVAWCILHEFTHIYRRHDSVHSEISAAAAKSDISSALSDPVFNLSNSVLNKAFEHDADLCATAKIYRFLQRRCSSIIDDITIRKMALFYLYWGVRTLPEYSHSDSHPEMYERLYEITQKLAHLPFDQSVPYIMGQGLDKQLVRVGELYKVAMALERAYIDFNGEPEINAYWHRWFSHVENRQHTQRAKDWQRVSPWVQRISGTIADNRRDVFYFRRKEAARLKALGKIKRKNQKLARRKNR
jgi:hypothetical protein